MAVESPKSQSYRRLPGRSRRVFALADAERQQLWMADTHILNVRIDRATERHRRFYLNEIQAIVVTKTDSGRNLNVGLGVLISALVVLGLILLLGFPGSTFAWSLGVFGLFIAGGCLLGLLLNLFLGKTCASRLYTAVQTEELQALGRVRSAERFLAVVAPLIEQRQGTVPAETLERHAVQAPQASQFAKSAITIARDAAIRHTSGHWHAVLFASLIVGAIIAGSRGYLNFAGRAYVDATAAVVLLILSVVALVKQRGTDLPPSLRGMTWAGMIVLGMLVYVGSGSLSFIAILDASAFETLNQSELWSAPMMQVAALITATALLIIGVLGTSEYIRHGRAYARLRASGSPRADDESEQSHE